MEANRKVYETILHLLEEKGPCFTTAELAQRLRISKRTLYKMFPTKAEIIDKTLAFFFHDLFKRWHVPKETRQLSSSRLLQIQLSKLPEKYDLDKILNYSQEFERLYPEQWQKLQRFVDELGKMVFDFLVENQNVRLLTVSEQKVLLRTIQLQIRQLLDGAYLKAEGLSFKEALQAFYQLILRGILY
ncbi:TetR/AcrR family transcriptional regulator [Liquorilactobacillus satsumensis]|uniref:HTH tetR-type domain-containing protein n=1 Tax=Liquorilactobacillus satsumensis DSM 16230 = JCM 12392 TaxID=1423801 RepID=A0A0R1UZ17_9LACO|nr:TetR/AcrR family transcriptional regulator [Liquorilactobacillus satsumensis]KRL98519.1 hypothetical protein FD50_GL000838 [Liquorilactobacillus satsumensis DSM 16230 = JCM 12392]MCC7667917.1 TetR/AcrR family transcriptional regulator [Liquorilactobacillus satsumensis]MCP9313913.1 TetR/AcrR family transcriptional regulator [Liquorilactobacillus satsumensis]MCP9329328.1 TetR/AcrR family transcriptional regulator [Liquorilactobacillus satsumensis]MCP9358645.1 TetR/AcrR family transcriptional 